MLLLLLTKMPKSIQQKTSAETLMDQWFGSIQVYSYSPDSFYQKWGVWSLLPLRPSLLNLSDQRRIRNTHAICEHLSDQDGDVPLGCFQVHDASPTHSRNLSQFLLRHAGTLSRLLEDCSKDFQIFV